MSDDLNQPPNLSAIDFLRTRSLANVVQAEIERMIIDGELKPNERVNENGLSQRSASAAARSARHAARWRPSA